MDDADSRYRSTPARPLARATLILGAILALLNLGLTHPAAPMGLISVELSRHLTGVNAALSAWQAEDSTLLYLTLTLQFPFILAYTGWLIAAGLGYRGRRRDLFLAAFALAGFCDLIKTAALWALVLSPAENVLRAVYYFATLKWGVLLTGLVWLIMVQAMKRRRPEGTTASRLDQAS